MIRDSGYGKIPKVWDMFTPDPVYDEHCDYLSCYADLDK